MCVAKVTFICYLYNIKSNFMKKSILKKILYTIIGLSAVIFLSNIFLSSYFKSEIKDIISKQITIHTNGMYQTSIDDIRINLFTLKASALGISFFPDENKMNTGSFSDYGSISLGRIDFSHPVFVFRNKRISEVKNFTLKISDVNYTFPDSLYYMTMDNITFFQTDSTLQVDNITYRSFVPQYDFAYKDPKHSDWMDLTVGSLAIRHISISEFIDDRIFKADLISLADATFQNYKNQNIPIEHHKMPLIYEQVQRLPYPFLVKEVKINDLSIYYRELAVGGKDPGEIYFSKMNISTQNFTNIIDGVGQNNDLKVDTKLMGEGLINAQLSFPVDTIRDEVIISGKLGPMSMIALNSMIEPLAPTKISGGTIQELDFRIVGGKEKAVIDMCFLYRDLSVDILLKNDENEKHENPFLSFLATGLIRKNNPEEGEEVLCVTREHLRDPMHSSFNYLWKIYFAGLKETLGYTEQREESINWVREKIKELKED